MREIASFIPVAIIAFLLAGSGSASAFQRPDDRVLIKVVSREWGMVCSTNEYLELQALANGAIEGDVLSQDCTRTRKTASLRTNQLQQLATLLRNRGLLSLKSKYRQFDINTDSGVSTTVTLSFRGKEKKIALVNPDPESPVNRMKYPHALIRLLLEIKDLRKHLEILGK